MAMHPKNKVLFFFHFILKQSSLQFHHKSQTVFELNIDEMSNVLVRKGAPNDVSKAAIY